jgi:signal peptidase
MTRTTEDMTGDVTPLRRALGHLRTFALVALTVGALYLVLPPSLGGRTTFTMVAGTSMEPTYHTYDLAITWRTSDPEPGDIIVYKVPDGEPGEGRQVIHRVIGGDADDGYVTQGDNRPGPDIWEPRRGDVVGTVVTLIPKGGLFLSKALKIGNIGLVALAFIAWAVWPRPGEDDDETGDEDDDLAMGVAADAGTAAPVAA